jgi:hypothetical protein
MKRTIAALILCAAVAGQAAAVTFTGGPYLRLRHEYWKNVFDMNDAASDDRNFYRFKLSLWGQAAVSKDLSFFARLTNESKAYVYYANGDATYNINEAVFDSLYADIRDIARLPLDLRIGRQDFSPAQYGDGFIFADGTPLDGSRTYYFNAARASWRITPANTLDALYILDPKYDSLLPVINEAPGKQQLNSTDETAYALYGRSELSDTVHLEGYYVWKHEDAGGPLLQAQETRLSTIGSYCRWAARPWLNVRGQLAGQSGTYGTLDRRGLGGFLFADAALKDLPGTPQLSAGYVYLSGDDRATAANEAWDPLFSRYPWLSEIYALSYARESGSGYWTNLSMPRLGITIAPTAQSKFSFFYNVLAANETAAGALFGAGTDRGTLYQGRADYAFTKTVTSYVLLEYFTPGDFYAAADPAVFTRVELQIKY